MEPFSALLDICEVNPPVTGVFPLSKTSGTELLELILSAPEQALEQTIETPVIWDVIVLILTSP